MRTLMSRNDISSHFWIGANDIDVEGVWKWSGEGTKLTYTNWASNQPDDLLNPLTSREDCVVVYNNQKWHDIPCTSDYVIAVKLEIGLGFLQIISAFQIILYFDTKALFYTINKNIA